MNQPKIDLSPKVSDEIRKTTCYMCACRCGINVHMKEGKVAYIEGNRDHPVNKGVLCAKGSAGIMQVNAPSRLQAPMKRVGPRGSGEFETISWDEALQLATDWLEPIRNENPEKLAFFTGRDQSQSFTSFWAQNFGTPNYAAHGGFPDPGQVDFPHGEGCLVTMGETEGGIALCVFDGGHSYSTSRVEWAIDQILDAL